MIQPIRSGRLLFNVLATVAEFESDLIRMRAGRNESGQGQGSAALQAAEAGPFRARLFRSLSVTGLCLAGLPDDEAELRDDLADGGLGGLKGNNLARPPSRNKQLDFA
jgi:hypothetical protein